MLFSDTTDGFKKQLIGLYKYCLNYHMICQWNKDQGDVLWKKQGGRCLLQVKATTCDKIFMRNVVNFHPAYIVKSIRYVS